VVLRRAAAPSNAQTAALAAKGIFARMGAKSEIRKLANQGWDEAFATSSAVARTDPCRTGVADAGKYAELLTYLDQRSKDELERVSVCSR